MFYKSFNNLSSFFWCLIVVIDNKIGARGQEKENFSNLLKQIKNNKILEPRKFLPNDVDMAKHLEFIDKYIKDSFWKEEDNCND